MFHNLGIAYLICVCKC